MKHINTDNIVLVYNILKYILDYINKTRSTFYRIYVVEHKYLYHIRITFMCNMLVCVYLYMYV
jgi:hypothetical protein